MTSITKQELIESLHDLYEIVNVRAVYGQLRSGSKEKFNKARELLIKASKELQDEPHTD